MKITIGVNQKVGQPNYGSAGASCEIVLDLAEQSVSEHPESLVDEIRRAYALAQQAVFEQLERQAANNAPTNPPPRIEPDRERYPSQARPAEPPDRDPNYRPPNQPARRQADPEPERRNYDDHRDQQQQEPYRNGRRTERGEPGGKANNGNPRNGRQLMGWAKRLEDSGQFSGLTKRIVSFGRAVGFPEMVVSWDGQQVDQCLNAIIPPEQPQYDEPARNGNGHTNGYGNGTGRN